MVSKETQMPLAERIYRHLYDEYHSVFGVCGLMGVMYEKSGLDPTSVDAVCKKKLKAEDSLYCTDQTYTQAVDSNIISRSEFISPLGKKYGYGLMQWDDKAAKREMYDQAKENKLSIGDLDLQLDYLILDIEKNYIHLRNALIRAMSLRTAVVEVMNQYLHEEDSSDKEIDRIIDYSRKYYDMFSSLEIKDSTGPSTPSVNITENPDEFHVNDRVIVTGKIYGNGYGTGTAIVKNEATMYVVGIVNKLKYPNYIAVATKSSGLREGWASPTILTKLRNTDVKSISSVFAKESPESKLTSLKGDYSCKMTIYMRNGAGSQFSPLVTLPQGHVVYCSGRYTSFKGSKWFYVETIYKDVRYTGFCSAEFLHRL